MKHSKLLGAITAIVLLMASMAFGQSQTTYVQTVTKATLTPGTNFVLASSANPSIYGANVTFTGTLSAAGGGALPTGTLQFMNGASPMGAPVALAAGVATYSISSLAVGSYPITAVYSGDSNYNGITSLTLTQVVNKAALNIAANNATKVYGAALPALTATYTGFVNGDTSASLTTAPTLTTTATAASSVAGSQYTITAAGAVDPNYTITYTAGSLTVTAAPLTITANNASRHYNVANPAFTFAAAGFVNGDTVASLTTQPTLTTTAVLLSPTGTYPITAAGAVDTNYSFTYNPGTLTVTPATSTTVTLASSLNPSTYGASVTFTATVPVTATGTITFLDGATSIGTGVVNPATGIATFSTVNLAVGTHPITASYPGDTNYPAGTSASVSQVVNKGGVTFLVNSSANPATYGQNVTFTITVTGFNGIAPTGTVTVSTPGWTSQTPALVTSGVNGVATFSTSTLPAGTDTLTIVYNGDPNYQIIHGTGAIAGAKAVSTK
jgi:Bacterial Ig-like domain (group 3)/MBG domain (YGX type)